MTCNSKKEFWIIWSPEAMDNPSFRHDNQEKAMQEAKRLAQSNPGQEFIVLLAITGFKVDNLTETIYQ